MIIPAMRFLGLKIDRPTLITLKMANKRVVRPEVSQPYFGQVWG
jgi:hypothetical protein